jgi:hypothetical protein
MGRSRKGHTAKVAVLGIAAAVVQKPCHGTPHGNKAEHHCTHPSREVIESVQDRQVVIGSFVPCGKHHERDPQLIRGHAGRILQLASST